MGLNEEKPGTFVWLSTLQYRCFGRKPVPYSVNKLVGKFRLNPPLGIGLYETGHRVRYGPKFDGKIPRKYHDHWRTEMFGLEWTKGTRWWRSWPVGPFRQEAAVAGHRRIWGRTSSILNLLTFGWVTCKETGKKQDTGIEDRGTGAYIEGGQSDLVLPTWRLKPERRTQFMGVPISVASHHPSYAGPSKWQQWSSRNSWCAAEGHWEAALRARGITTRLRGASKIEHVTTCGTVEFLWREWSGNIVRKKRGGGNSCTMELLKRIQDTAGLGADSSTHWGIGAAYYHRCAHTFRWED